MNRRNFIRQSLATGTALGMSGAFTANAYQSGPIRIGIIGLDTPHGSKDIESSVSRIPKYTDEVKAMGVEIADSIQSLLKKVDVVLLETNDGRLHKEQALLVIDAGKPMFIDKPVAASLADAIAIYDAARKKNVPIFSCSSLRYMNSAQQVRYENKIGKVLAADTYSPATLEPHHPDLFWYGIHGVEILFTLMGKGCESVMRYNTPTTDIVIGQWSDGRVGTFRGMREGKHEYGGVAFGTEGNLVLERFEGY